jgi:hypothetical protein
MKTDLLSKIVIALGTALLFGHTAVAQSYNVPWFTIGGGGGASSGSGSVGAFALAGTIGQADAGPTLVGGGFNVTGGFWSFLGNASSAAPTLRIRLAGTSAFISWPNPATGFELQETAALLGSMTLWSNVNQSPSAVGADKQVTVPATSIRRLYRLRKP